MPDYLFQRGPGSIRNLETDRRLKRNRPQNITVQREVEHGGQGRIKDPALDRRLKKNRPPAAPKP